MAAPLILRRFAAPHARQAVQQIRSATQFSTTCRSAATSRGRASQNQQADLVDEGGPYVSTRRTLRFYPLPPVYTEHGSDLPQFRVDNNKLQRLNVRHGDYHDISGRWLRDICPCPECRNPQTGQRNVNVFKGNVDCSIRNTTETSGGAAFEVTFEDDHRMTISEAVLTAKMNQNSRLIRGGIIPITTWDSGVESKPPTAQYEDVKSNGLGDFLRKIREYGFCFVEGIEPTPEATESFLQSIGPIRNTHYGGFYDFTSDLSSKDTAYTSEALEPHTDNTYFTESAGLQALHLLSHTDGSGGESSLVDGFGAAAQLFKQDKQAYYRLSLTLVYGHASGNDGISIQPAEPHPVLAHSGDVRHLMQVRWNNADRAGIQARFSEVDAWYDAAAKFDAIISDPKNQYWFRLTPGKLLVFDNWRVLHGRAAFTGKRRMAGGYIPRDDFISKFKATNMTPEEIKLSTVTG